MILWRDAGEKFLHHAMIKKRLTLPLALLLSPAMVAEVVANDGLVSGIKIISLELGIPGPEYDYPLMAHSDSDVMLKFQDFQGTNFIIQAATSLERESEWSSAGLTIEEVDHNDGVVTFEFFLSNELRQSPKLFFRVVQVR